MSATTEAAIPPMPAHLADVTRDESSLRRFLHGLPGVDPVGLEQRAAGLATRSIKKASKLAATALAGTSIGIASVATAFPTGRTSLAVRLADTRVAVEAGATEVDMVIDRGAFLAGRYGEVFADIVAVK